MHYCERGAMTAWFRISRAETTALPQSILQGTRFRSMTTHPGFLLL
jgi:hypothetical protein